MIIAAVLPLGAAEKWIKLDTPHFEMYTTNGQVKSVEALRIFEEARYFFEQNNLAKTVPDVPVRIVAFKSEKEYKPYTLNQATGAYYQRGHKRDYIVMQGLGSEFFPAAIHEYTHLFIEHMELDLPLWLNEGLADVYSSLQLKGKQLMIGAPPPGRLEALRSIPPLDLRQLLRVNRDSAYYRNPAQMDQFYADSWALAHMLLLGKNYADHFPQFLGSIADHKGAEESFKAVYHKSLEEVSADLRSYFSGRTINVSLFDTHLNREELEPELNEPAPLETDLVLADLLSTHAETAPEARSRLNKLAVESPGSADVEESLAYLSWQEGKTAEARQHFEEALRKGSKNPLMIYQYAALLHASGGAPSEIIKLLAQAIALKPDLYDARFNLGMEAMGQQQCGMVISSLTPITRVKPDRAFFFFSALAYCEWKLGNPVEARRQGELAEQYAQDPAQRGRIEAFLQQLAGGAKPPP